jgi:hypothetical protein
MAEMQTFTLDNAKADMQGETEVNKEFIAANNHIRRQLRTDVGNDAIFAFDYLLSSYDIDSTGNDQARRSRVERNFLHMFRQADAVEIRYVEKDTQGELIPKTTKIGATNPRKMKIIDLSNHLTFVANNTTQ